MVISEFIAQAKKRIFKKYSAYIEWQSVTQKWIDGYAIKAVCLLRLHRIQHTKLGFIYEVILISEVAELKSSKAMTRND